VAQLGKWTEETHSCSVSRSKTCRLKRVQNWHDVIIIRVIKHPMYKNRKPQYEILGATQKPGNQEQNYVLINQKKCTQLTKVMCPETFCKYGKYWYRTWIAKYKSRLNVYMCNSFRWQVEVWGEPLPPPWHSNQQSCIKPHFRPCMLVELQCYLSAPSVLPLPWKHKLLYCHALSILPDGTIVSRPDLPSQRILHWLGWFHPLLPSISPLVTHCSAAPLSLQQMLDPVGNKSRFSLLSFSPSSCC